MHQNHPVLRPFWLKAVVAVLACVAAWVVPAAQGQMSSADVVKVRAVVARASVMPGDAVPIAVVMTIDPGWHTWTSEVQAETPPEGVTNFADAKYTQITLAKAPSSSVVVDLGRVQWPDAHTAPGDMGDGPTKFLVYEGKAVAYVLATVAPNAAAGAHSGELHVRLQACDEKTCKMEATIAVPFTVTVAPDVVGASVEPQLFAKFDADILRSAVSTAPKRVKFPLFEWEFSLDESAGGFFPILLLLAFCGGILLNFTPCVLPIIPLKIMGLSAAAAGERRRTFALGAVMSAGVIAFWLALGLLIGSFTLFQSTNEFFQYPAFTISVGLFIAFMAASMGGFFTFGLPQWVYAIEPKHETYFGSLIFGVMTAVLSTPCTAPLMGAAAGWAVTTDSPATVLAVFFAIGCGMAAPYMLMSAYPQLAKRVPKSGPGSEVLKQVMGLLLLAAAAYFIGSGINGIQGLLEEPSKLYWWVVAGLGAAAGVWLVVRTVQLATKRSTQVTFVTTGIFIAVASVGIGRLMSYEVLPWNRYTEAAYKAGLDDGKIVVVDFTADWCLNCKFLEKTVLEPERVSDVLREPGVLLLKVDFTATNQVGSDLLAELGHAGIPYLVIYNAKGEVVFTSDAYTQQQVLDAVRAAQGSMPATATQPPQAAGE